LDQVSLCNLTADHVRGLIESASTRGYSPQTIKHIKNVVGAIITHAQNEGVFKGNNPASKIRLEPTVHRASRNITIRQAKAVVALLDGAEREIAILSLTTGMSAFEICKLQWKHVNLSSVPVVCQGEMIPAHGILIHREPTSSDLSLPNIGRTKTVDIPDALFRRLLRTKRLQQHSRPDAFVLGLRGAVPPSGIIVSRARLVRVGRELGIPWLSWQVLKRGHQALLAELRDQITCSLVASAR
jgi:integrase